MISEELKWQIVNHDHKSWMLVNQEFTILILPKGKLFTFGSLKEAKESGSRIRLYIGAGYKRASREITNEFSYWTNSALFLSLSEKSQNLVQNIFAWLKSEDSFNYCLRLNEFGLYQ